MTTTDNPTIHRLLDELFAAYPHSADLQDLKEELRGSLLARAAELESAGMDSAAAARTAVDELGDIADAVGSLGASSRAESPLESWGRHRVRPRPAFVMRAVVFAVLLAAGIAVVILGTLRVVPLAVGLWSGLAAAVVLGVLVGDSLSQETTVHYRMPRGRAAGYGVGAALLGAGLTFAAGFLAAPEKLWLIVSGAVIVIGGALVLAWLGVTQTNRTKAWALASQHDAAGADAFTRDPAAAARFGIYTVVIWGVTATAFLVLSVTIGFAWSWVAIAAGAVVFFLTLARMLFPVER